MCGVRRAQWSSHSEAGSGRTAPPLPDTDTLGDTTNQKRLLQPLILSPEPLTRANYTLGSMSSSVHEAPAKDSHPGCVTIRKKRKHCLKI